MLKPADPGPPPPERPIGELVHELVEEGKAYARAEFDFARAVATAKAKALALPFALFATAFVLALAAVTALAVGVVIALAKFLGPLLAGIVALIIFAGIAGALAWWGAERVKRVL
jgi:hypothetical protein